MAVPFINEARAGLGLPPLYDPSDPTSLGSIYNNTAYLNFANSSQASDFETEFDLLFDKIIEATDQQQQAAQASADRAMEFSSEQAELQRKFNAAEAQKNRDFQSEMSNTAVQRAMSDLEAAGLNPKLISNLSGASTPSGSVAASSAAPSGVNASMAVAALGPLAGILESYINNSAAMDRLDDQLLNDLFVKVGGSVGSIARLVAGFMK